MGTVLIVGLLLWAAHLFIIKRHPELGNERLFPRQLIMLGLTFSVILIVVLALPINESSRNQIIALLGLLISGVFAFSSSTLFANLMAGVMLRVTKPFFTGDFVSVGEYFGRVTERGLLDTELQSENRELVALPNTYLINNPVSVTRSSGAIVSTTLSLGYDVHHSAVDSLLIDAANHAGLSDPFVQILELGDYSITYKVSGMLTDIKSLLTSRSNLRRSVLDHLHAGGVEILSPAFMSQRHVPENSKVMPLAPAEKRQDAPSNVEAVVFDKAEQAEQVEHGRQVELKKIADLELQLKDASEEQSKRIKKLIAESLEELEALKISES